MRRKKCGICFEIIPASVKLCVYCGGEAVKVGQWESRGSQEGQILLHGVIHSNGFGHLIAVNGNKEGREKKNWKGHMGLRDDQLTALWNNMCWLLNARKVSLHDSPQTELRVIHAVIHGEALSSQWGYKCASDKYKRDSKFLHRLPLQIILQHFQGVDAESVSIIVKYMKRFEIHTLGEIFSAMIVHSNLENQFQSSSFLREDLFAVKASLDSESKKEFSASIYHGVGNKKISSRHWSKERLQTAERVVMEALQMHQDQRGEGWLPRHEVREKVRKTIGDTGLIDFVLKSIGNRVIGGFVVRRAINSVNKVLQFRLEDMNQIQDNIPRDECCVETPVTPEAEIRKRKVFGTRKQIHACNSEVKLDILYLYNTCLHHYVPASLPAPSQSVATVAAAVKNLQNNTYFLKDLEEESAIIQRSLKYDAHVDDYLLRVPCCLSPDNGIPAEVVFLPLHATVADLRTEVAQAFRETYVGMEDIKIERILDLKCDDDDLLFGLVDSDNVVVVEVEGSAIKVLQRIDFSSEHR